jgi:hypothetical protein
MQVRALPQGNLADTLGIESDQFSHEVCFNSLRHITTSFIATLGKVLPIWLVVTCKCLGTDCALSVRTPFWSRHEHHFFRQ